MKILLSKHNKKSSNNYLWGYKMKQDKYEKSYIKVGDNNKLEGDVAGRDINKVKNINFVSSNVYKIPKSNVLIEKKSLHI